MKRSQRLMHRRHRFLIEIGQNPNDQIGCVYLLDPCQRLLCDEITFHSSASVLVFFSPRDSMSFPVADSFTAQAT
jgi:hypothetical protein